MVFDRPLTTDSLMATNENRYVLACNAGSSSLKFELFTQRPVWASSLRGAVRDIGQAHASLWLEGAPADERIEAADHAAAASLVLRLLEGRVSAAPERMAAVGHRVVHGGGAFSEPLCVSDQSLAELEALSSLAPLHNPPALAVLGVIRRRYPGVPMVAVFDTAFFSDLPEVARRYAVPEAWFRAGVHRYGFHGIAHRYLGARLAELEDGSRPAPARAVTLQLGHGCSVTALEHGRPVETSMGLTPLEGLIMGARPGDLDPGAVLHMARRGLDWSDIDHALNHESGLKGLSAASSDVRELLSLEAEGHAGARIALRAFCHRVRKYVGAYAAVLGGLDAVAFGGGIGEHAPEIRERICSGFQWLGLELDPRVNEACRGQEARISTPSSRVAVRVIPVNEEAAIARAAVEAVRNQSPSGRSD